MSNDVGITLEEYVERMRRTQSKYHVLQELYREWLKGKVRLTDPQPPNDYIHYLLRLDYSLWFWTIIALTTLTILSIVLTNMVGYIIYMRYILGSIFVLYLPGATLIEALYPREEDLSPLERLALSIGLSLAVVPLIGLILNYTPWGIRLEPIIISLTLFTLSMTIIASWRKYKELMIHR